MEKRLKKIPSLERARQYRVIAERLQFHVDRENLPAKATDLLRTAQKALAKAAEVVKESASALTMSKESPDVTLGGQHDRPDEAKEAFTAAHARTKREGSRLEAARTASAVDAAWKWMPKVPPCQQCGCEPIFRYDPSLCLPENSLT